MKMFKKLMAVALAGVMALVVLTGCAGDVVNKKEILAQLNDSAKGGITYTEESTDKADKVIALAKKAYDETEDDEKTNFDINKALFGTYYYMNPDVAAVSKALGVTDKTKDQYIVRIAEVAKRDSEYFQKHSTALTLSTASSVRLNNVYASGNKATVSMNTVQLGDTEYLVMVIVRIA